MPFYQQDSVVYSYHRELKGKASSTAVTTCKTVWGPGEITSKSEQPVSYSCT